MRRLAIWRLRTYEQFGGTWFSDYASNRLGGFVRRQRSAGPKMVLVGQNGNTFGVLGRVSRLLKQAGRNKRTGEMFQRATGSGSYNGALCIVSECVETKLSTVPKSRKSIQKKGGDTHER